MGIYTRSLSLLIIVFSLLSTESYAQKRKKKKNKNKVETAEVKQVLLATELDSISYALGMGMAENLSNSGVDSINLNAFNTGMKSVFAKDSTLIDQAQVQAILSAYFGGLAAKVSDKQLVEGKAFLAKNKLRPEVDTTISGLQYEVINAGEGPKPNATNQVTVHYEGKLLDGTVFDSSYERNQEIQFNLGQVIPGWTEGLQLMSPGAKYLLYIPSELAYGARGAGADIPPNATLIFTVELISIDD